MKLSELVALRNNLNSRPISEVEFSTNNAMVKITSVIPNNELILNSFSSKLTDDVNNINQSIINFGKTLDELKLYIQEEITKQERHWFQESYRVFEELMSKETTKEILNRRLSIFGENTKHASFESESVLRGRLASYSDWRFPALIIRPGLENFINEMVGYDPLYIVDQNSDLLKPCLSSFPKQYQNRLRPYLLDDQTGGPILDKIPNNQFGMCLVYNFFNYRPFEIIKKYLSEIFEKLRPGGICLMTINDCDLPQAVELVEKNFACYTPGYLVQELIKSLGFNIASSWGDGGPSVWLEIRKPGTLDSMRGNQVVSVIKHIAEIDSDIDFIQRRAYSKEEINKLHNQARSLKIDENIIISSKPYDLELVINEELDKLRKKEEVQAKRQKLVYLKTQAKKYNIEYDDNTFEINIDEIEFQLNEIKRRINEEEERIKKEAEKARIDELYNRARSLGIDIQECANEKEVSMRIAEEEDKLKKQELVLLRQRAMELGAGDPNLIRYGYSAEKLKQLIKEKEKGKQ